MSPLRSRIAQGIKVENPTLINFLFLSSVNRLPLTTSAGFTWAAVGWKYAPIAIITIANIDQVIRFLIFILNQQIFCFQIFDQQAPFSAYVRVIRGCSKFCHFCVVPFTRGLEHSRPIDNVFEETKKLVHQGVKEITLLGQNVNAYRGAQRTNGKGKIGLGQLLRKLAEIENLDLLRYTTSHPIDMDEDLIRAHGELDKLVPFLHLPVQSGSNRVLERMNRRHRREDYLRIVDKLIAVKPNLKFSSDFIVGFPGETQEDFEATLALVNEVGFIQAFSFKYSPRPGTPGALMNNKVPEHVKTERLAKLQDLLVSNQRKFNESCVGSAIPVLLDRQGRKTGQLAGRTPYMQAVHVTAPPRYLGKIMSLRIEEAFTNSLAAVLMECDSGLKKKCSKRISV